MNLLIPCYILILSFSIGSVAYEKLCSALTNTHLVKGIKQASPFAQTSCLEGFHSVLNHFAPKMIAYSYAGMYCRYNISFSFYFLISKATCIIVHIFRLVGEWGLV